MTVVDASALLEILLGASRLPPDLEPPLCAPPLVDVEVASALRRLERRGTIDPSHATALLDDAARAPIDRFPHEPILRRAWQWRHDLSVYEAIYVALAEALGAPLCTADRRLARRVEGRVAVRVLGS